MPTVSKAFEGDVFSRALQLELAEKHEAAIDLLTHSIEDESIGGNTADYRAYALRGRLLHQRGRWVEAIRDLDVAVKMQPTETTARFFRACARAMLEDFDGARSDLQRVVELEPQSDDPYYEMGHIEFYCGNLAAARRHFENALRLNPDEHADDVVVCEVLAAEPYSKWRKNL